MTGCSSGPWCSAADSTTEEKLETTDRKGVPEGQQGAGSGNYRARWSTAGPPLVHRWSTAGPPLVHRWSTAGPPAAPEVDQQTIRTWILVWLRHLWVLRASSSSRPGPWPSVDFGPLLGTGPCSVATCSGISSLSQSCDRACHHPRWLRHPWRGVDRLYAAFQSAAGSHCVRAAPEQAESGHVSPAA
ncbi:uncharacterized protein V6R79_001330 [Siganus canaliculatus]